MVVDKDEAKRKRKGFKLVTDLKYYMDGYLADNLKEIPKFLKKSYDCVIIVSGHGKVRIGKSTMAQQVGYYIAWLLAGGLKSSPTKEVRFSNDNIVFSPDDLMEKAAKLPKNSIIIYDEGRAGLDSARAMESINKGMMDFMQECGQYGHVILIVLPNFFKLSEDIAISRSLFLLDVYSDRKYNRGYFKFYNEVQKEFLYVFGKRKIGSFGKYSSAYDSFHGRFTKFCPIDEELYQEQKRKALKNKRIVKRLDIRLERQRNSAIYELNKEGVSDKRVAAALKMSRMHVTRIIDKIVSEKELNQDEDDET